MDKSKKGKEVLKKIKKDRGEFAETTPIFRQWAERDPAYLAVASILGGIHTHLRQLFHFEKIDVQ